MSNLSELLPSGGGQNQVEFVASGTLPNGKPVILKSNGQVEVVGISSTSVSQSIPLATEVVFDTGHTTDYGISFDPNTTGKFVIVYKDLGDGNKGKVVVGSISGTTLSFGSEVEFSGTVSSLISTAFDPNTANKFVIVFRDASNSNYGRAIVGTVSGTSVSIGSRVNFNSASTEEIKIAFDPNTTGKFVVSYRNGGNSSYGTAIVGTVAGTSTSFGTAAVFRSAGSYRNSLAFDPNTAGKFVITFRDGGNSNYGTAVVGTMSGSSLSFGSLVAFDSSGIQLHSLSFDPNAAGIFVLAYRDYGNSNYGSGIVGTVAGTSTSFGSKYVFNSGETNHFGLSFDPNTTGKFVVAFSDTNLSGQLVVGTRSNTTLSYSSKIAINSGETYYMQTAFDPNSAGKFVTAYYDGTGSARSSARLGQIAATVQTTNLTSTNLIGIAADAASSGATAKINTWGGINESQTSLTIGTDYYAQTNGTITTATGGQKLGTAISATTINMRDLP